ncbi:MAG: 50S ribosomal protein L10 [Dehalococcoidia bacterium]|nr:50S ribosomal protein L10 [Dehalococcoidia bacterium]
MATEKKKSVVAELTDMLSRCTIAILTVPTGMSVAETTEMRRKLREAGVEFRVVKNTLARRAAKEVGKEALDPLLTGPTGIVFGYGDQVAPAKALLEYGRAAKAEVKIKGGILEKRLLSGEDVRQLAHLPSREVLIAQVLGGLQAPIVGLVWVLKGNLSGLLNVLQARKGQLEPEATA